MPGPELPDSEHVARYCSRSRCDDEGRPLGTAFMPKPEEPYLSVNWLEKTGANCRSEQLDLIRHFAAAGGLTLRASGKFAVLALSTTLAWVQEQASRRLSVCHEPIGQTDPTHCGIYGYSPEDQMVADLLALKVSEVHPALK